MNSRKLGGLIFGIATLIVIGLTISKVASGENIGFNEIITISILLMMYFSAITWGTKGQNDGIRPDEELGKRITERSAVISYYVLIVFILAAVALDQWLYGTSNILLLILLGLAMMMLPFVQFLVARKYQDS